MNRIAQYLPYRTTAMENLSNQHFPEENKLHADVLSPLSKKPDDIKREHNAKSILSLVNLLQYNNLMTFSIFGVEFLNQITFHTLKQSSTSAPVRK